LQAKPAYRLRKYFPVVPTEEHHGVTTLELFFDLVFVFALTQITAIIAAHPTPAGFIEGLVILALLWWGWVSYSWLGNQAKADEGALRLGLVIAMGAMFVCALSIPHAFKLPGEGFIEPWLFAIAYSVVRAMHIIVYRIAAEDDPGLRRQIFLIAVPVSVACALLLIGAFADPTWQIGLWLTALAIDYGGVWVAGADGWRVPSPRHFAERYGLIIIVALGESIVAIGVGIGAYELTIPVVIAAMLSLGITVCLWWLYFDVIAIFAERLLAKLKGAERARIARDSYSYLHFPMLVGIVVLAIGLKRTMAHIADLEDLSRGPFGSLPAIAVITLCLGPAIYLAAHLAFRYRNIRTINKPRLIASILLIGVIPICLILPAIFALTLVAVMLGSLVIFEVRHYAEARYKIRHDIGHTATEPTPSDDNIGVGEIL
jgi:low temperature requirement protein LtrA